MNNNKVNVDVILSVLIKFNKEYYGYLNLYASEWLNDLL